MDNPPKDLTPIGEIIEDEIITFLNNFGTVDYKTCLVFPPNLGDIISKSIRFYGRLFNLHTFEAGSETQKCIVLCRRQHLNHSSDIDLSNVMDSDSNEYIDSRSLHNCLNRLKQKITQQMRKRSETQEVLRPNIDSTDDSSSNNKGPSTSQKQHINQTQTQSEKSEKMQQNTIKEVEPNTPEEEREYNTSSVEEKKQDCTKEEKDSVEEEKEHNTSEKKMEQNSTVYPSGGRSRSDSLDSCFCIEKDKSMAILLQISHDRSSFNDIDGNREILHSSLIEEDRKMPILERINHDRSSFNDFDRNPEILHSSIEVDRTMPLLEEINHDFNDIDGNRDILHPSLTEEDRKMPILEQINHDIDGNRDILHSSIEDDRTMPLLEEIDHDRSSFNDIDGNRDILHPSLIKKTRSMSDLHSAVLDRYMQSAVKNISLKRTHSSCSSKNDFNVLPSKKYRFSLDTAVASLAPKIPEVAEVPVVSGVLETANLNESEAISEQAHGTSDCSILKYITENHPISIIPFDPIDTQMPMEVAEELRFISPPIEANAAAATEYIPDWRNNEPQQYQSVEEVPATQSQEETLPMVPYGYPRNLQERPGPSNVQAHCPDRVYRHHFPDPYFYPGNPPLRSGSFHNYEHTHHDSVHDCYAYEFCPGHQIPPQYPPSIPHYNPYLIPESHNYSDETSYNIGNVQNAPDQFRYDVLIKTYGATLPSKTCLNSTTTRWQQCSCIPHAHSPNQTFGSCRNPANTHHTFWQPQNLGGVHYGVGTVAQHYNHSTCCRIGYLQETAASTIQNSNLNSPILRNRTSNENSFQQITYSSPVTVTNTGTRQFPEYQFSPNQTAGSDRTTVPTGNFDSSRQPFNPNAVSFVPATQEAGSTCAADQPSTGSSDDSKNKFAILPLALGQGHETLPKGNKAVNSIDDESSSHTLRQSDNTQKMCSANSSFSRQPAFWPTKTRFASSQAVKFSLSGDSPDTKQDSENLVDSDRPQSSPSQPEVNDTQKCTIQSLDGSNYEEQKSTNYENSCTGSCNEQNTIRSPEEQSPSYENSSSEEQNTIRAPEEQSPDCENSCTEEQNAIRAPDYASSSAEQENIVQSSIKEQDDDTNRFPDDCSNRANISVQSDYQNVSLEENRTFTESDSDSNATEREVLRRFAQCLQYEEHLQFTIDRQNQQGHSGVYTAIGTDYYILEDSISADDPIQNVGSSVSQLPFHFLRQSSVLKDTEFITHLRNKANVEDNGSAPQDSSVVSENQHQSASSSLQTYTPQSSTPCPQQQKNDNHLTHDEPHLTYKRLMDSSDLVVRAFKDYESNVYTPEDEFYGTYPAFGQETSETDMVKLIPPRVEVLHTGSLVARDAMTPYPPFYRGLKCVRFDPNRLEGLFVDGKSRTDSDYSSEVENTSNSNIFEEKQIAIPEYNPTDRFQMDSSFKSSEGARQPGQLHEVNKIIFNTYGKYYEPSYTIDIGAEVMEKIRETMGDEVTVVVANKDYTPYIRNYFRYMSYAVELFGFPKTLKTRDLLLFYTKGPRYLKWCDDTHAILILSSTDAAAECLGIKHSYIKVRPMLNASPISILIASQCVFSPASRKPGQQFSDNK